MIFFNIILAVVLSVLTILTITSLIMANQERRKFHRLCKYAQIQIDSWKEAKLRGLV